MVGIAGLTWVWKDLKGSTKSYHTHQMQMWLTPQSWAQLGVMVKYEGFIRQKI